MYDNPYAGKERISNYNNSQPVCLKDITTKQTISAISQ